MAPPPIIHFRLDPRSGLAPFRQLIEQVRQAVSLDLLRPGDQLPSVREVVTQITINPNTVHRAYRDLEHEGVLEGRPGLGTFIAASAVSTVSSEDRVMLLADLREWVLRARQAGLDAEGIAALGGERRVERGGGAAMSEAVAALETVGLGKRYGTKWGLKDCSFYLPEGRVAALVGPNGSGKSTLLRMAAGITRPSAGGVRIFGRSPQDQTVEVLREIGYLDQERPLYRSFRVAQMLHFGASTNPRWDDQAATRYLAELDIPLGAKIGKLSIGQQAQVALAMCLAKRPDLLLLDEPVAALDPVAREGLMHLLLGSVADGHTTVLLSSHAIADLVTVCDYLIVLSAARVHLADDLDYVLASHRLLAAPTGRAVHVPPGVQVISRRVSERQIELLVRVAQPVTDPSWRVTEPTLEEIVLAYLREQRVDANVSTLPSAPAVGGEQ